jgi:pyruvate-formate lyase-activating enzyme
MTAVELPVLPSRASWQAAELLVLASEGLARNAEALFQELSRSSVARERFLSDSAGVLAEWELLGDRPGARPRDARIGQAGRLLFSLLDNPEFVAWGRQLQERMGGQVEEITESGDPTEALRRLVAALDRGRLYREIDQATRGCSDRETRPEGTDRPLAVPVIALAVFLVILSLRGAAGEPSPLALFQQDLLSVIRLLEEQLGTDEKRRASAKLFDRLPKPRQLAISVTLQCNAECTHCATSSSPREKTRLPLAAMLAAIDQAAAQGYDNVGFTGGEPTLAGKNLLAGIERAASHGLAVGIVTNACWAGSDEKAERRMKALVNAGLTQLRVSTGDEHARFVPVENVVRAARAAVTAGLNPTIMVEMVQERRVTRQSIESHPEFQRLRDEFPRAQIEITESPWMPLSSSIVSPYPEGVAISASNLARCGGCHSVLSTTLIEADGTIAACCGIANQRIPELHVGNIGETKLSDADRAAADDFLKRWIRVEGPERILAWAASHDPAIEWENQYGHPCQACLRLYQDPSVRKVIADRHQEKIADVLFAEWLFFHYKPASECSLSPQESTA